MATLLQDLRYGFRSLLRNPGFTIVSVLTLALGIGANTTMFSVLNSALLQGLPFPDAGRLVTLWEASVSNPGDNNIVSMPNFRDWRAQNHVFEDIAMFDSGGQGYNLAAAGDLAPERASGVRVTASFFPVLGVPPMLGRTFTADEEITGKGNVVVLSNGLWKRRFGADPNAVGRTLRMDGQQFTIVGVMPSGFDLQFFSGPRDLWVPMQYTAGDQERGNHSFIAFARIKKGVALAQAKAEMDHIGRALAAQYPADNHDRTVGVIEASRTGTEGIRSNLYELNGVVVFVLLIACVNVANLMLARSASRGKEFAIRCAMGASRGRVIRQLLTESLLLSLIGCGVGLLTAAWTSSLVMQLLPSYVSRMPFRHMEGLSFNLPVFAFAVLTSLITGVLFGLAPAWSGYQRDPQRKLKEEGDRGTTQGGGARLRYILVSAEVALALVVLFGAGLMIASVKRLIQVPPGFEAHNILTMAVTLPQKDLYNGPPGKPLFCQDLQERAGAIPGVLSVSATSQLPMNGGAGRGFVVEGQPLPEPGNEPGSAYSVACPGYFRTMGIAIHDGREFNFEDTLQSTPVIVVNETLARRFWKGQSAVGKRIRMIGKGYPWMTVVGVTADIHNFGLDQKPPSLFYRPYTQASWPWMSIAVRTAAAPATFEGPMKNAIREIDPDWPVSFVQTMDDIVAESVSGRRFTMILLSIFAGLALLLAAVGIAGVVSVSVAQRTHEIGIRMALGARTTDVLSLVVTRSMTWALLGVAAGIGASLALGKVMASEVYEIAPNDPQVLVGVALLLAAIALLASYLPARRAAKVDPMTALRAQ